MPQSVRRSSPVAVMPAWRGPPNGKSAMPPTYQHVLPGMQAEDWLPSPGGGTPRSRSAKGSKRSAESRTEGHAPSASLGIEGVGPTPSNSGVLQRHPAGTPRASPPARSRTSANRCRSVAVVPDDQFTDRIGKPPRAAARVASPTCLPRTGSFASYTTARARPGSGDATSRSIVNWSSGPPMSSRTWLHRPDL